MVDESVAALEARLDALEDEHGIRRLLARYSTCADSRRDDDWLDLWSEDGVLDIELGPDSAVYGARRLWTGRDELRLFITNPDAHHRPGFYGRSLHVQTNESIVVSGATAVATTYAVLLHNDDGALVVAGASACAWRFLRVDGVWLIRECVRRRVGADDTEAVLRAVDGGRTYGVS